MTFGKGRTLLWKVMRIRVRALFRIGILGQRIYCGGEELGKFGLSLLHTRDSLAFYAHASF